MRHLKIVKRRVLCQKSSIMLHCGHLLYIITRKRLCVESTGYPRR